MYWGCIKSQKNELMYRIHSNSKMNIEYPPKDGQVEQGIMNVEVF